MGQITNFNFGKLDGNALNDMTLTNCEIDGANLCSFVGTRIENNSVLKGTFFGCNFTESLIDSMVDTSEADFVGCNFTNATLRESNIIGKDNNFEGVKEI